MKSCSVIKRFSSFSSWLFSARTVLIFYQTHLNWIFDWTLACSSSNIGLSIGNKLVSLMKILLIEFIIFYISIFERHWSSSTSVILKSTFTFFLYWSLKESIVKAMRRSYQLIFEWCCWDLNRSNICFVSFGSS